ncbi:SIS domain-containing protein [Sorangium sp. So ce834]|uniref:D-sedoheptulose-7-phosphate isomerase n=1 Tax=Sorangium sp. So ce834 TaxID=3133321 RepID=UPI003F617534
MSGSFPRASAGNPDCNAVDLVRAALRDGIALRWQLLEEQTEQIAAAAAYLRGAIERGNKLLLCGNGGSAADCQHIAAELTGRFGSTPRRALPALALTTDTSALTAIANDFGFAQVFARQVEALGKEGDVLWAVSTSGSSPNVLRAAEQARAQGLWVLAMSGPTAGELGTLADITICVPGRTTDRIQELHVTVGHIICNLLDQAFIRPRPAPAAQRDGG